MQKHLQEIFGGYPHGRTLRGTIEVLSKNKKLTLMLVIIIALALNAFTFCLAYPETFKPMSPVYAKDFSAYYIGEYRLLHNPSAIYIGGNQPGDYPITPNVQTFKYTPSFLIFFAPFITLSYQNALNLFDVLQFVSVFASAFFVYKIVKDKKLLWGAIAAFVVLIAFQPGYFWGYSQANAHIIQTSLLLGSLYFGYSKKLWLSGLLLAVAAFDPRGALLAVPLLLWYNRQKLLKFGLSAIAFLAAFNLPFFFYQNIGLNFLQTEVNGDIVSQIYSYDLIPIFGVATLTILEVATLIDKKTNFSLRIETKLLKQKK
jgi:hypothetical protein